MTARNHWQAEAIRFRFAADKDTTAILSLVDNPTKGIIARFKIPTKYFKSGLHGTYQRTFNVLMSNFVLNSWKVLITVEEPHESRLTNTI